MSQDIVSFVRKWNASQLTERSAAPQHFRDLCDALGVPHPTEEDVIGSSYTYEKRVSKTGSAEAGFADVWKRGYFAWEYKSKGGDLKKAYKQLNEYHEALENPPLLIVCDFEKFEVHTKFENVPSRVYSFTLDDLLNDRDTATSALPPLEVLRHVFGDFNQLRPGVAAARVTEAAASDFLRLAKELELERAIERERPSKEQIAHFLMRLVFCLFADSVELLPNHAFRKLVTNDRNSPRSFNRKLPVLFAAMSEEHGFFGADNIPYFNGGLFSDNSTIELNHADLGILYSASQHDWSHIEPAIFGTLFERSLDAAKRSMIGAHYTSTEDILLLIEPVVMTPLVRRWETVKSSVVVALAEEETPTPGGPFMAQSHRAMSGVQGSEPSQDTKSAKSRKPTQPALRLNRPALNLLQNWASELSNVRILDPACGSGNFLYVALKRLLDLWHDARIFAIKHGLTLTLDPIPNPGQLFGIETDFYAHEIASIVVWIGFLQWKHDHGVKDDKEPLLQKLTNIEHADAIMRYDAEGQPYEPEWPAADFIIGNPPFLGSRRLRHEMGDSYVDDLFRLYAQRVPQECDLVTYWFSKAIIEVKKNHSRAGLLATQAIRAGVNRVILNRIAVEGSIFFAWSNREWLLEGAAIRVSMVGFDDGTELDRQLDGATVAAINIDLSSGNDLTQALSLKENAGISFQGPVKVGQFEVPPEDARKMLSAPVNPNGLPNSEVLVPWINAKDITGRPKGMYIIDFLNRTEAEAALFELPFEYVKKHVYPERAKNNRPRRRDYWWQHGEKNLGMRKALASLLRYIVSPRVSKHRFFEFVSKDTLADSRIVVISRGDHYFLGTLESRLHNVWSIASSSRHGVGNDITYNIESCFDTFPFPYPPGTEPTEADSPIVKAIADAARELVRLRDAWLNPPNASEADLKDRTLTKLYNARPEWLVNAHRTLDTAVFAAYGWPSNLADQEILARLLALNHERAGLESAAPPSA